MTTWNSIIHEPEGNAERENYYLFKQLQTLNIPRNDSGNVIHVIQVSTSPSGFA